MTAACLMNHRVSLYKLVPIPRHIFTVMHMTKTAEDDFCLFRFFGCLVNSRMS